MAPGLSWPLMRASPVPGAGVGTPFADWGELAGEAGRLFPTSPFGLPAGGVGSAGLAAGTLCAGGCCGSPEKKSSGTAVPAVSTIGSFLVTSTVFVSSIAFGNAAALIFPDVNGKPESPPGLDSPSELESSGWLTFKGDFPGLSRSGLTAPSLMSSCETPPATPAVPASRTPSNASGAPSVLTGHGGGGVMKVGSGLGSPGKIVVV